VGRRGRWPTSARSPAWRCSQLAAWGLFKSRPWWKRAASAGAVAGLAALVPFGIAAFPTGVSGPGLNSAIPLVGSAAVLLIVQVPAFEGRFQGWLTGDRQPRKR
jgi:peptidoglycan/LPS O-acetylase OafA/YrhL